MKLLVPFASFASASVFCGSLIAACGGSSSSNPPGGADSGTSTTDSGAQPLSDSSTTGDSSTTPGIDAAAFACTPTSGCTAPETCCITQTASSCIAAGATCSGAAIACVNTGGCTGGDVCCGVYSGGTTGSASCQAAPCAAGDYQLCASSTECPSGESCHIVFSTYGYCVAGADGGSTDSGSTDAASDASGD
ncbi:MAG: hypothetical protein ACLQVI_01130 [Polyangiaceae bacterium]|jgi:hypothetical protein